jgi:hypothetical protein
MTKHTAYRARPLQALFAALAILAVSLVAAAPQASASSPDPACNYDGRSYNACLSFEFNAYGWANPHVGLDVWMPEQYARDIVACGANFQASLWGDDPGPDQFIRSLSVAPGWPIAQSTGLAVNFWGPLIADNQLNEDEDSDDELYARISFYDCHTGGTRNFTTGIYRGYF